MILSVSALLVLVLAGGPLYQSVAYEKHVYPGTTFTTFTKRAAWFPGEQSLTADQRCAACQLENHPSCFMGHVRFIRMAGTGGSFTVPPLTDVQIAPFECDCTCEHSSSP